MWNYATLIPPKNSINSKERTTKQTNKHIIH